MSFLDKIKPFYEIGVTCDNCGKKAMIKIKKGVSVTEAIRDKSIKCDNCKCAVTPEEYTTQWLK